MNRRPMLMLLLVLVALPGYADPIQVVTETSADVYLKDGKVAGPATEVVEATLRRAGLHDYRITLYPWARAYRLALSTPNVLIYLIARTEMREPKFKWVGELGKIRVHLYKLADRADIAVHSLAEARNYRIGVMRDDVREQYLRQQGFTRLVLAAESLDNFEQLLNGRVDLLPLNDTDPASLCASAQFDCSRLQRVLTLDKMSIGSYMAYSTTTPDEIVERTRQAFEAIRAEGLLEQTMPGRP